MQLNIEIVIADGNPEEFSQVNNTVENVTKNANRVGCGWNIVHQNTDMFIQNFKIYEVLQQISSKLEVIFDGT